MKVGSNDEDNVSLLCKMCDIYGQALTTELQKRRYTLFIQRQYAHQYTVIIQSMAWYKHGIWHIKTAVINWAEYDTAARLT
jgi:hypothetical protein